MKVKKGIIKLFVLLLIGCTVYALIAAVERTMNTNTEMIVYNIIGDKEAKTMVSEDDLKLIMDREFNELMVGTQVAEINIKAIEERLLVEPHLSEVAVFLDVKGVLHIEVKPRIALFRVLPKSGQSYYVDYNGVSFPLSKYYTPRVQIVTGNVLDYKDSRKLESDQSIFEDLVEIVSFLVKDEFLYALIEEIYITREGRIEMVPKVGEHRILYGKHQSEDMADRFENLKIFCSEGLPYEGWNKYKTINIEFKGQVVCSTDNT